MNSVGSRLQALVRLSSISRFMLTAQFERCRASRTKNLSQGFTRFRMVSARYQFPGVDIPNFEEYLSKFVLKTRAAHGGYDEPGECFPSFAHNSATPESLRI